MNKHNTINPQQTVLVIGGHGFIGKHIAQQLRIMGAKVIVGTRKDNQDPHERCIALNKMKTVEQWKKPLNNIDVVVNAVGILRQRLNETYDQVHHLAVGQLAQACAKEGIRFVHVSALGLKNPVKSRFITSKLRGEEAIKNSSADWAIVRPSLVEGGGGFGAKWFRRVAQWPIHMTPANAHGVFAPIHVNDLGEATAKIALTKTQNNNESVKRIYELGGNDKVNLKEYLQCLRQQEAKPITVTIPTWIARGTSHLLDFLHLSPYSFGHYELLKHDNYPVENSLAAVLSRPATVIGKPKQGQKRYPQDFNTEGGVA